MTERNLVGHSTEEELPMVTPREIRETGTKFTQAAQFAAKAMQELAGVVDQARRRDVIRRRRAAERAKRRLT